MKSGKLVIAYVGKTWIVVVATALLLGLSMWGVGFAVYQRVLVPSALPLAVGVVAVASTGLMHGFRARATVASDGLVLAAPFRSRTIGWDEITEVDMVFDRTWVRCRDSERRVSVLLATSAWHPRTNGRIRRDNEALATLLWTEARAQEAARRAASAPFG